MAWLTPPLSAQHYTTKGWESPAGSRKFLGERRIFSEFRLYAVVNERGSSVIAFHLLPHSETGFTGRGLRNLQNVYNFMPQSGFKERSADINLSFSELPIVLNRIIGISYF